MAPVLTQWFICLNTSVKYHSHAPGSRSAHYRVMRQQHSIWMLPDSVLFFPIFLFNQFYCYSTAVFPIFPPFPSSTHPIPCSHSRFPHCCHIHGLFIHVLCLVPSPSSHHYPPSPSPLVTFSLFHVSMSVVLFCSLVYFVH